MTESALDLFLRQRRFDLIFKFLCVRCPENAYVRTAYLESIRAFNGFVEVAPSDGVAKDSPEKFWTSFQVLIESIRAKGFDVTKGAIPVQANGEIFDGGHRLAIAAAEDLLVETVPNGRNELYDWSFFVRQGMDPAVMDYGALEYVKLNPNAYVVCLHSVADSQLGDEVLALLNRHGFVYYAKSRCSAVGGRTPVCACVFVCPSTDEVRKALSEIRSTFDSETVDVRVTDTHQEAVERAEAFFTAGALEPVRRLAFIVRSRGARGLRSLAGALKRIRRRLVSRRSES